MAASLGPVAFRQTCYRGRGCMTCAATEFRGRRGIYEWLPLSDVLREGIGAGILALRLREEARKSGMHTLREAGLAAAFAGETTLTEALKDT